MPADRLFPTTLAGSLPKPSWLAEPEKLWPAWRMSGADLEAAKRDAALVWLKLQEDAGIDIVTDGEQFRIHFVHGFVEHLTGIDFAKKTRMGIRNNRYVVDVPTVTAKLARPKAIHVEDAKFVRAHTRRKFKVTLPGPMTIADTVADSHYGRRADMAMAFAELLNAEALELEKAGVDVIQFDEPAFNVFMGEVIDWGIPALERAAAGLKCETAVTSATAMASKPTSNGKRHSARNGASTSRFFRPSTKAASGRFRSNARARRCRCR